MTNSINEVEFNDVLFVIGSNTTEAHPIIGNKMKRAVKRGAKLILIDPRGIELSEYAHLWLRLRPGTDIALINGIINLILNNNWANWEYIAARTEGIEELKAKVADYPVEKVVEITGIPADLIYEAARLYATTEKAGIFYTLGITEHTTGTANVMSLANLAMITGHLGIANAGINPLRGQNNVQGACDMGALPDVYAGYQKVVSDARQKYEAAWKVSLPENPGLRIPEMMDAAAYGYVKCMYVIGEDPILTDPDSNHVRKALANLEFLVVQDLFLTETAQLADVVLPGASFAEKDGTFTNTERRVQRVRQAIPPLPGCRPDWEIICDLAGRMGYPMNYASPEEVFNEVCSLAPAFGGMSFQRLEKSLQWPCPTKDHPGTPFLHVGQFSRGKGVLQGLDHQEPAELPDAEYPILLSTGRMLYHYGIMTRHSNGLNTLWSEELAEVNPADAEKWGIADGDQIRVTSRRGSLVTRIRITERVLPGVIFMTYHFKESPVNELTNSAFDPITKTGEYKVCAVKVEPVTG